MKILFIISLFLISIFAQDAVKYQKGKIDMHGGKFDNYNSIGGYKDGNFRYQSMNLSKLLDNNTSTKALEKKLPSK
ncbi:MAG: hypothetical protein H8E76_07235 [Helicobacteraceae bacterium]|nr:hypothetical protein [Candidatus Sulfurimonas ponti]